MLGGVMRPTSGHVRVAGAPADVASRDWRHRVGIVSHQSLLYGQLTVEENLRFYGRLFGLSDLKTRIPERLGSLGLSDRASTPVRDLSRGLKQRAALARALLHDPEVLLLDEPYTGLDPHASGVLREQLASLKDGRQTVVLVTHNLIQGLELADRVAIQVQGRFSSVTDSVGVGRRGVRGIVPSSGGGSGMRTYLGLVWTIARKDLLVEFRTHERLTAMGAFVVLIGVLFNFSINTAVVRPQDIAAALIWMTIIFGGMLGMGRTFRLEQEDGALSGILQSPIPLDALYLGKVLGNFILLSVMVALVFVVFGAFFNLRFSGNPLTLLGVVSFGVLGFVSLTTLFSAHGDPKLDGREPAAGARLPSPGSRHSLRNLGDGPPVCGTTRRGGQRKLEDAGGLRDHFHSRERRLVPVRNRRVRP